MVPKQSVVVIEDLVSTGKSSLQAVNALRESGCEVKGMVSIFTYGLKTATENFKKEKCRLYSLCNYDILVEKAAETSYITEKELKTLKSWRDAPESWGK